MAAIQATIPFATMIDALVYRVKETPDQVAYDFEDGVLTYADLMADAEILARGLFNRGVDRGGRCALVLDSGAELVCFLFAVQMLGAAPVVIDPGQPSPAIIRRLRDVRAEIAIAGEHLLPALHQENSRVHSRIRVRTPAQILSDAEGPRASTVIPSRDDLAAVVLSPGTEGEPHGVTYKHRHLAAWTGAIADHLELTDEDVMACHAPLYIGMNLAWFVFLPLVVGCVSIHRPFSERSPEQWLRAVARHEPTFMAGNDTFLRLLAGARFWETIEMAALHTVIDYGEPPRQSTIRDFEARFGRKGAVRPGYGLVETVGAVAVLAGSGGPTIDRNGIVASGRPLAGFSVRVVGPAGEERPVGEIGEIAVSGAAVFEAYFDNRTLTAERLRGGWFHTGDLGYFDDDGSLFVLGRDHEIIRHRDRSLLPRQVEDAAAAVDDIESLAAIGRPQADDAKDGHQTLVIVAEVSRTAGEDRDQMKQISDSIDAAVTADLGVVPDEILLVKKGIVPRTADGRTAYGRLRGMVAGGDLVRDGSILYGGKAFISPLKR